MAQFDRKKEYEDLYELRDLIKETVKRAVDRIPEDRMKTGSRHEEIMRMVDKFTTYPAATRSDSGSGDKEPEQKFRAFYKLRRRILRAAERAVIGFRAHAIPFAAVNSFLVFLWMLLDFGGHPWFLYPLGAWGIGLMCHLTATKELLRRKREIQSLPDLIEQETKVVRKMQSSRSGFAQHFTAVASLSGFLVMIDVITGGAFPWSLIPVFGMATGLLTHWAAYSVPYKKRRRQVLGWMEGGELGASRSSDRTTENQMNAEQWIREAPEVKEVERLVAQIVKTLEKLRSSGSTVGEDLYPVLNTYPGQIRDLCRKEAEVGEVIDLIPTNDLEKERQSLEKKYEAETSQSLKMEYQKSIQEIDRQTVSLDKLRKQREILALRIRSAVNSLRQIQIDLARMNSESVAAAGSGDHLKSKIDELSRYLDDLSDGYAELD